MPLAVSSFHAASAHLLGSIAPQGSHGGVLLLGTQFYGAFGGVPAYGRMLAEILSAYAARTAVPFLALSLIDATPDIGTHSRPVEYTRFCGAAGRRFGFVGNALTYGLRHRPAVAVIMHVSLAPVADALLSLGLLQRYVLVLHGCEAWRPPTLLQSVAARHAGRIVATTEFTATAYRNFTGLPPHRLSVIPLAIRRLPVAPKRSFHAGRPLRVLTVGRQWSIERYKGTDDLIRAVAVLLQAGTQVELSIVGSGDDIPRLEQLTRALGVAGYVQFLGSPRDEDLDIAYQSCDVFAMPSRAEGFGIAFIEAMSYGTPCIGGRHGGTPEVIDDGVNGFLVEHGSVGELSRCLAQLCANRELLHRLGTAAREKVERTYLPSHMETAWFRLLDDSAQSR